MGKKRKWGIALLVIGLMAFIGSIANGTFAQMAEGIGIPDITVIVLLVGLIVGGIVLIIKGKE